MSIEALAISNSRPDRDPRVRADFGLHVGVSRQRAHRLRYANIHDHVQEYRGDDYGVPFADLREPICGRGDGHQQRVFLCGHGGGKRDCAAGGVRIRLSYRSGSGRQWGRYGWQYDAAHRSQLGANLCNQYHADSPIVFLAKPASQGSVLHGAVRDRRRYSHASHQQLIGHDWSVLDDTQYATFSMRSADGQYLMVEPCASANAYQSNSGGACSPEMEIYNAATLNWIVTTSNLLSWNGSAPEPRWNSSSLSVGSGVHAFTYRKNTQLREYNVDTQADVLIFDFCTFITNAYIAGWGDSNTCAVNPTVGYTVLMNEYGSWSDSGQYIALIVKWSANNDEPMVLVYDRVGNAVYSSLDIHACIAATICPKGILISPSGGYVVVNYFFSSVPTSCTPASTQGGQIAYTKNFTTACIQVGSDPEHINFGYDNQGNEVAWAFSQQQYLNFIVLSTGKTYELYDWSTIQYPGVLFPQRGPNGWGFLQTYTLCASSYNCTLIASGSATTWASESTMGSGRIAAVEMDETKCKWFFNSYHDEYNSSGAGTGGTACGTLPRVWQIASTNNDYLAPPISPFTNQPWSSSTSYLVDDVVTSGGTGYLALVANTNVTPSGNPSTWQAISTDTSGSGYFMQINFQYDPTSTYLGWFGSNWLNGNSNPAEVYQSALPVNWTSDLGGGGNGPLGNVPGRQPRL